MKRTAWAVAALAAAFATPAMAQLADGSFETQGAASIPTNGYCYLGAGGCAAGSWQSNGGGGFIGVNDGAWPGIQGDGAYHGFIQGSGSLFQTFTAASTGVFAVSWLDAGRSAGGFNGPHAYTVVLNGFEIASFATDGQTAAGQGFTQRMTGPFAMTAGSTYTLNFKGIDGGIDSTSFIDNVGIAAAVPEPATWGMMILGFGAIGVGLRRRKAGVRTAVRFA